MSEADRRFEDKARRAIVADLERKRASLGRKRIYLVSYPRSGNTLVREYCAILQGRRQYSVYPGDVVGSDGTALTAALDHVDVVKSHQMPAGDEPIIYLVRDGRNATLSFLYMAFLFGGHGFSRLDQLYDGVRFLDRTEGSWADHVAAAVRESDRRNVLVLRYEDLVRGPEAVLSRTTDFLGINLASSVVAECVNRHRRASTYAANPFNGFLHMPEKESIYEHLQRHRSADYWRLIFDSRTKRYFHESGATPWLLRFDYESSADWWQP